MDEKWNVRAERAQVNNNDAFFIRGHLRLSAAEFILFAAARMVEYSRFLKKEG